MSSVDYPVLKGSTLFKECEQVYLNKSDELKDYCGKMHKHDFIEIAYVIQGKGIHIVGNESYETSYGDLFIINTDVEHGFFPLKGSNEEPVVYNCGFTPEFLDHSLLNCVAFKDITSSYLLKSLFPETPTPLPDLKLQGVKSREIGDLFDKMYNEYKQMKKGYVEIIRAYVIMLLVNIFRQLEAVKPVENQAYNRKIIEKSIEFLKNNYNKDIGLEEIAMKSFVSKNYFSKLFKEETGINFRDFVQRLRIEEACRMLKGTDRKVIDIAHSVGFNDIKSFYEIFKKIAGSTPGDYRKQ